jgi:hypothetical protein
MQARHRLFAFALLVGSSLRVVAQVVIVLFARGGVLGGLDSLRDRLASRR